MAKQKKFTHKKIKKIKYKTIVCECGTQMTFPVKYKLRRCPKCGLKIKE